MVRFVLIAARCDGGRLLSAHAASPSSCNVSSGTQATRQLQRMGLPMPLAARLQERNVTTAAALYGRTLLDLVELLDLPYDTVQYILREVAVRIVPPPQTVRCAVQPTCTAETVLLLCALLLTAEQAGVELKIFSAE
jgi:hypothetical protein